MECKEARIRIHKWMHRLFKHFTPICLESSLVSSSRLRNTQKNLSLHHRSLTKFNKERGGVQHKEFFSGLWIRDFYNKLRFWTNGKPNSIAWCLMQISTLHFLCDTKKIFFLLLFVPSLYSNFLFSRSINNKASRIAQKWNTKSLIQIHKRAFNYEPKRIHEKQIIVDKATEFEGEKQHGKNLFDYCRAMVALKTLDANKRRAKIYRYCSSCRLRLIHA